MFLEIAFGVCFGILMAAFIINDSKASFFKSKRTIKWVLKWALICAIVIGILIGGYIIIEELIEYGQKYTAADFTKHAKYLMPLAFLLPFFFAGSITKIKGTSTNNSNKAFKGNTKAAEQGNVDAKHELEAMEK